MSPINLFLQWYKEESSSTKAKMSSACCLSSTGLGGFPNARYVSLKDVADGGFIITGSLKSRKGIEIEANNKVALTFWWTETERQVRIQGHARKISGKLADQYFSERSRESQIVSIISKQGKEIDSMESLHDMFQSHEVKFTEKTLRRPEDWGGYLIAPLRIEFLEFKTTRLHSRRLFELKDGQWEMKWLQP